ncbi:MAG: FtsH protease activity modulator HflK [Proteobacteria bacterium]|nr:FtsH protease activity modulator HflK [Pseudomonadota bacterium]
MAWNQPNGGKNENPWGRRPGPGSDLDERLKGWTRRLQALFRGEGGAGPAGGRRLAGVVAGILLLLWLTTCFYTVGQAERGVVQRFGALAGVAHSGPHVHWPWPIETVTKVNVELVRASDFKARFLTSDVNLIDVNCVVRYQFTDPVKKLFGVSEPEQTLSEASQSALREIVGRSTLTEVLDGAAPPQLARRAREVIQRTLDAYDSGMTVTDVSLQGVSLPEAVISARNDLSKAQDDGQHAISDAEVYARSVRPMAEGTAARTQLDAQAYKAQALAIAQGHAARFTELESAYAQAPEVTRRRMYLETLETVLGRAHKVLIDGKGGGNMVYLPIDKLLEKSNAAPGGEQATPEPAASGTQKETQEQVTVEGRARGQR